MRLTDANVSSIEEVTNFMVVMKPRGLEIIGGLVLRCMGELT